MVGDEVNDRWKIKIVMLLDVVLGADAFRGKWEWLSLGWKGENLEVTMIHGKMEIATLWNVSQSGVVKRVSGYNDPWKMEITMLLMSFCNGCKSNVRIKEGFVSYRLC